MEGTEVRMVVLVALLTLGTMVEATDNLTGGSSGR